MDKKDKITDEYVDKMIDAGTETLIASYLQGDSNSLLFHGKSEDVAVLLVSLIIRFIRETNPPYAYKKTVQHWFDLILKELLEKEKEPLKINIGEISISEVNTDENKQNEPTIVPIKIEKDSELGELLTKIIQKINNEVGD